MGTKRKVQIFSTKGKRRAEINTDAKSWKELRNLIEAEGYDTKKLNATENINRNDLAHDDAILPQGDFTVFLRPKTTKSGIDGTDGLGFRDLRGIVKKYKESHGDTFMDYMNDNPSGKSYTQLSTEELREKLASFNDGAKEEKKPSKKKSPKKESKKEEVLEMNNEARFAIASTLIEEVSNNTKDEFLAVRCEDLDEEIQELVKNVIEEDGETSNLQAIIDSFGSKGPDLSDELAEANKKLAKANDLINKYDAAANAEKEVRDELEQEAKSLLKGF